VNRSVKILVYHGKHGDQYWLVDTPERLAAAMRALFADLDDWGCYVDEPADLLAAARGGDMRAVKRILESRNGCEYEGWDIEDAEIAE